MICVITLTKEHPYGNDTVENIIGPFPNENTATRYGCDELPISDYKHRRNWDIVELYEP